MKKKLLWIAGAAAAVAVFAGIVVLYNKLIKDYKPQTLVAESQQTDFPPADSSQTDETESAVTESPQDTSQTKETQAAVQNRTAPDFTVTDTDGQTVRLSDMVGKPVVINFWATWCYYCKEEMPDFNTMYEKYGDDVVFMMVNMTDGVQETEETAKAYISDKGYSFPVYFDTALDATYAYNITGLPATFFIDNEGNLIARAVGAINEDTLENGIGMIMDANE